MQSIRLEISDNIFDKVIYFLQNLPKTDVKIIEEKDTIEKHLNTIEESDIKAFSNHTAGLIEEWKHEDDVWK